jgi:phosphoglycerol transferase MdoB-like AlkP superfamily enzyme
MSAPITPPVPARLSAQSSAHPPAQPPARSPAQPRARPPARPFTHAARRIGVPLLRLYLAIVAIGATGRAFLLLWQHARVADLSVPQQLLAFVHGLRMDTMAAGFALLPVVLVLCLWPRRLGASAAGRLVRGWMIAGVVLFAFMEVVSFPFFAEYDVRPNHLFVEYLRYPKEVGSMIWKDQKLALAAVAALFVAMAWGLRRMRAFRAVESVFALPLRHRWVWLLPFALTIALGIRSSLGHRPANVSDALYSTNRVANEVAKNSAYNVARAAMQAMKGQDLARRYGAIDEGEAFSRLHRLLSLPAATTPSLRRTLQPVLPLPASGKPRNLVLIVQESMGAQFVGFTGGRPDLTPHIDALAADSLAFTNLHANGTRSIRGLSALSAGIQAVPGEGVIKRFESQSGFFTVASLLKPLGYHASFIYGGEGRFDNMKPWYLGNGFDEVIEQKDYPSPRFSSTWGVSDEDLLTKAHERFTALAAAGQPFVSVVFTSSNHTPFELPEDTIEWVPGVHKRSVENAIKYADHAVGAFFAAAKKGAYYADTVFVVAADHNVRVYGDDAVPVAGFHIPALIHGVGIAPRRHTALASQPDVLATALTHLGVALDIPILGNPLGVPHEPFVLMQFNDVYGFRRGDKLAVLQPEKPAATFTVQADRRLTPSASDAQLERDGLALIHATERLVTKRLYK